MPFKQQICFLQSNKSNGTHQNMARLLVLVNSVVLLLFGSDMFLVGASKYKSDQLLLGVKCAIIKVVTRTIFSFLACLFLHLMMHLIPHFIHTLRSMVTRSRLFSNTCLTTSSLFFYHLLLSLIDLEK